jgi:hypothetical protein
VGFVEVYDLDALSLHVLAHVVVERMDYLIDDLCALVLALLRIHFDFKFPNEHVFTEVLL